jgi:predicted phage gp36 major capsid-like protein
VAKDELNFKLQISTLKMDNRTTVDFKLEVQSTSSKASTLTEPTTESRSDHTYATEQQAPNEEKIGFEKSETPIEVTWDGDADPKNPRNWPKWKKW